MNVLGIKKWYQDVEQEFNQWGELWRTEIEVRSRLMEEAEHPAMGPERLKQQRQQIMATIMALAEQAPSPTYTQKRLRQNLEANLHL